MTKKSTKKSLAMSILSMTLCVAMLIGSTYAWFSDEAKTGPVNITAGTLDVEVTKPNGDAFTQDENLFTDESKTVDMNNWEPGMMVKSQEFVVKNAGNLAFQYKLDISAQGEADKDITKVIKMKVVKAEDISEQIPSTQEERKALWDKIGAEGPGGSIAEHTTGVLFPKKESELTQTGKSETLVAILYWEPTDNDNEYNIKTGEEKHTATFTLEVFATQTTHESDSFGDQYDADAKIPVQAPDNAALEDLIEDLQKGDVVELSASDYNAKTLSKVPEGVSLVGDTDEQGDPATIVKIGSGDNDYVGLKNNKIANVKFIKENASGWPDLLKIGDTSGKTTFVVENCEFDYSAKPNGGVPSLEIVGPGTVKGCTFKGTKGILSERIVGELLIDGCTFNNSLTGIQIDGANQDSKLTIKDCTFNNFAYLDITVPVATMEGCTLKDYAYIGINSACNWTSKNNTFKDSAYIALWWDNITFTSTGDNFSGAKLSKGSQGNNYLFKTRTDPTDGHNKNLVVTIDGKVPDSKWFKPGTLSNATPEA